jgi:hypothetical protein
MIYMPLDPLEQRITYILTKHGASHYNIKSYLEDIFTFSDRELYQEADDEVIIEDFEDWLVK